MMRNRRMAMPSISRKRSHTGLIIGIVVFFIMVGIGVGVLIWYLNSDCYAREEIDAEGSKDDKCCKESKLKCELNKCCGNIGFKCSDNDECCDLNCDSGSCKKPEVECTKKDNECSSNDDCCDDLNCNSDNICADCKLKNVNCSDSNECCNENCSGGKCYEETQPGTPPPEPPPPGTPPPGTPPPGTPPPGTPPPGTPPPPPLDVCNEFYDPNNNCANYNNNDMFHKCGETKSKWTYDNSLNPLWWNCAPQKTDDIWKRYQRTCEGGVYQQDPIIHECSEMDTWLHSSKSDGNEWTCAPLKKYCNN